MINCRQRILKVAAMLFILLMVTAGGSFADDGVNGTQSAGTSGRFPEQYFDQLFDRSCEWFHTWCGGLSLGLDDRRGPVGHQY